MCDAEGINKCSKYRKVKVCQSCKCSSSPIVYDTVTQTRSTAERQLFEVHQSKPITSVVARLVKSAKTSHSRYIENNIIAVIVIHNTVTETGLAVHQNTDILFIYIEVN